MVIISYIIIHIIILFDTLNFYLLFKFFFFIVMIEFKPTASVHDGCSYPQAKTSIGFWYRRDLNPGPLLDDKRLYHLS